MIGELYPGEFEAMEHNGRMDALEQEPTTKNDCEHCAKTYGTLGCCTTVSNKWVYSCKEGHEEYDRGIRKLDLTTKNDLPNEAFDMTIKALEQEPCEDAISRQAVLKAIDAKAWEFCDYLISKGRNDEQKPVSHFADNLRECVREDLPPVNPQPKTGHWIESRCDMYECSECNHVYTDLSCERYGMHYCPNCGAKMIELQESEDGE